MTGADAQFQHHRRVARLRQLEAGLHHAHDGGKIGPRVHEPDRRFHGIGIGALLDDARAFAVVLAQDDQRPADHARRGEIRQRIGRHVGADDGFPGHRAAQRIVDRGAQHGGGRGLVGAGLHMHAETGEQILRLDHDVDQVRDRRPLITAHIAHAGLQQRLGDRQDAFAPEGVAVTELERFDFRLEGAFHGVLFAPAPQAPALYGGHCARSAYQRFPRRARNAHAVRSLRSAAWAKSPRDASSTSSHR